MLISQSRKKLKMSSKLQIRQRQKICSPQKNEQNNLFAKVLLWEFHNSKKKTE